MPKMDLNKVCEGVRKGKGERCGLSKVSVTLTLYDDGSITTHRVGQTARALHQSTSR